MIEWLQQESPPSLSSDLTLSLSSRFQDLPSSKPHSLPSDLTLSPSSRYHHLLSSKSEHAARSTQYAVPPATPWSPPNRSTQHAARSAPTNTMTTSKSEHAARSTQYCKNTRQKYSKYSKVFKRWILFNIVKHMLQGDPKTPDHKINYSKVFQSI